MENSAEGSVRRPPQPGMPDNTMATNGQKKHDIKLLTWRLRPRDLEAVVCGRVVAGEPERCHVAGAGDGRRDRGVAVAGQHVVRGA